MPPNMPPYANQAQFPQGNYPARPQYASNYGSNANAAGNLSISQFFHVDSNEPINNDELWKKQYSQYKCNELKCSQLIFQWNERIWFILLHLKNAMFKIASVELINNLWIRFKWKNIFVLMIDNIVKKQKFIWMWFVWFEKFSNENMLSS